MISHGTCNREPTPLPAPAGTRGAANIYARYVGRTVCHRTAIIAHADIGQLSGDPLIRGGRTADPDGHRRATGGGVPFR